MNTTALWLQIKRAIKAGNLEEVKLLIDSDPGQLTIDTPFGSLLHMAATYGCAEIVTWLIGRGLDVNLRGGINESTALHVAIDSGNLAIADLLLAKGAVIDSDRPERNPLYAAVRECNREAVELLLTNRVDIHASHRSPGGEVHNALSYAESRGHREIAQLLRDAGAKLPEESSLPAAPQIEDPNAEQILTHLATALGPVEPLALQEVVPADDQIRISVHVIRPTETNPNLILFTTGMSANPLTVPAGKETFELAELIMFLPADWSLPADIPAHPECYWPVQWLRQIGYFVHQTGNWLGDDKTILSNDEPPQPLAAGVPQTCWLIVPNERSIVRPKEDWAPLTLANGKQVNFYTLAPIYTEERAIEQAEGIIELILHLGIYDFDYIVDPKRPNFANLPRII